MAASPSLLCAQTASEFYSGKTVEVYIGTSVGGGYDAYARMLRATWASYIPGNPIFVPKNMEGGGGMRLANFLYNAAPKDGTAFGTFNRGTGFDPLLGNKRAQFDATKFNWIGIDQQRGQRLRRLAHDRRHQLRSSVLERELVVGASGPAADTYQFPKIANGVLGTKFKIVTGYPGGNDIDLAMERGEVQGRCGWSWTSVKATHQPWLDRRRGSTSCSRWGSIQASRPAGRAADHGPRPDRRGARDLQADLRADR